MFKLKVRAWNYKKQEMFTPDFVEISSNGELFKDNCELMLSSHYTDSNGVELYDRDYVKTTEGELWSLQFNVLSCSFRFHRNNTGYDILDFFYYCGYKLYVVGNYYETPQYEKNTFK